MTTKEADGVKQLALVASCRLSEQKQLASVHGDIPFRAVRFAADLPPEPEAPARQPRATMRGWPLA